MADFIHYVSRRVVIIDHENPKAPWFKLHKVADTGFAAPTYHVTRSRTGPAARVQSGDTIWLISQLRSPWGSFPPALDGKILVSGVAGIRRENRPVGRKFTASPGSVWFPLFDATRVLASLRSLNANGRVTDLILPGQPVGRALQSLRELIDAKPLLSLERTISRKGFHFVSYRLVDGTRRAYDKSCDLVTKGVPIFWDRWSLPRGLAERREWHSDVELDRLIKQRMAESARVWGIQSPRYAEPGSYSERERDAALRLRKLREW